MPPNLRWAAKDWTRERGRRCRVFALYRKFNNAAEKGTSGKLGILRVNKNYLDEDNRESRRGIARQPVACVA